MEKSQGNVVPFQIEESRAEAGAAGSSRENLHYEESDNARSACSIFSMIMDGMNHILILLVTVYLLYYSLGSFNALNLHVALCTVGYVLLMSEAIAVLAGENLLTGSMSRRSKAHVHWILQVLGVAFSLAGVIVMYNVKSSHFMSIHAITGITSIAIMCFITVLGYPVLMAAKLRNIIRPVTIKFLHNFLGISCFVIGMVAQCYGYDKSWLSSVTGQLKYIEKTCIVLTALITVLSLRGAIPSLFRLAAAHFR